jgi:hypothetical protein
MQGEWIKRPKGGAAVVFVHGILSSGEDCWRHIHKAAKSTTFCLRSLAMLFRSRWAMGPNGRSVVIALRSCRGSPT